MAKATKRKTAVKKKAAKRAVRRKPAAKKKVARRAAGAARKKKPAKRAAKAARPKKPAAKKVAAKRKAAAKKRAPAKKAVVEKAPARKAPAKKAAPKQAAARTAPAPAARAVPASAPRAAAPMAASAPRPESGMARHVKRELTLRKVDASPDVVAAVVAVGLGYRKGPASDPGFLPVTLDVDELVAIGLAEHMREGVRPAELDREMHRPTVRATVSFNLDQFGLDANGTVRDALASLALGSWRPGFDTHARRNALAGFVVAWYRGGLT